MISHTMNATVVPWAAEHEAEVDGFVAAHPEGLIYYAPAFRRFLLDVVGGACASLLAFEQGRLCGVLPMLVRDGRYGRVLNSLPFFGSNGGVLASTAASELALRSAYEQEAAKVTVAVWIAHPFAEVQEPRHGLTDARIAQWTDLAEAAGGWPGAIESSARRNLQKAHEEGIEVAEDPEALPFLEATHRENMAAINGRQKPAGFFASLPRTMTYGRDWRLYVATRGGEALAALLTFEAARTVEYVMPVVTQAARSLQPTSALLAKAMTDAAARGFRRWNWGGTWLTQDGVYRFKKKWGAQERRYRYFITLNDPALRWRTAGDLASAYPWYYTLPYGSLHPETPPGCANGDERSNDVDSRSEASKDPDADPTQPK